MHKANQRIGRIYHPSGISKTVKKGDSVMVHKGAKKGAKGIVNQVLPRYCKVSIGEHILKLHKANLGHNA